MATKFFYPNQAYLCTIPALLSLYRQKNIASCDSQGNNRGLMQKTTCYHFMSPINDRVDDLLPNGIVAPSIVVGSIFFAAEELLRVEERAVGPSPDLILKKLRSS